MNWIFWSGPAALVIAAAAFAWSAWHFAQNDHLTPHVHRWRGRGPAQQSETIHTDTGDYDLHPN
jgi:hypothetical protein